EDIRAQVVFRWGPQVLDEQGGVDRRKLGKIVFADPRERQALERIVFPFIEHRLREEIAAAQADPDSQFVVLDAAIMLEAGWNDVRDWTSYGHAPGGARLQRLTEQRGWSAKEVEARENAQLSLTEKVSRADFAVDNSGSIEQTIRQVDRLLKQLGIATSS